MVGEKRTLFLLMLISIFLFASQNVINPVVQEILLEYQKNEQDIGVMGSAFMIIGALLSVFIGYWSDRFCRVRLFAWVVLLSTVACFLTGFHICTQTYSMLFTLRVITGIGVAGVFPITFSLVGDYFSVERRATVIGLVTTAWGIGQLLGQLVSGFTANSLGWRFAFILVSIPNFLLIPIFLRIAQEPKRGAKEAEVVESNVLKKLTWADISFFLGNKTNWLIIIQGIPGSIPWGVLPMFLTGFYEKQGYSKEFATTVMLVIGITLTVGGILGGWLGDRIYRRSPAYLAIFCAFGIGIGVIPMYAIMVIPKGDFWTSLSIFGITAVAGLFVGLPSGNGKAILLNTNLPEHRGSVFSLNNIGDSFGRSIGPVLGGYWITNLGYQNAMVYSILLWIPCCILFGAVAWTIRRDIQRFQNFRKNQAHNSERNIGNVL